MRQWWGLLDSAWPRGAAVNTPLAAFTVFAVSMAGYAAHLWWVWVVPAGLVVASAAGLTAARSRLTGGAVAFRAVCWLAAAGWLAWALATSPWAPVRLAGLAVGAAALGVLAPAVGRHERAEVARAEEGRVEAERRRLAAEWVARVQAVCGVEVRPVGLKFWEFQVKGKPSGFSLDLDVVTVGRMWEDVREHAKRLAANAKLPPGCGVNVRMGAHQGAVVLDVATANALKETIHYPRDYSPLTVNKPLQLGVYRNGAPALGEFRLSCCLICGQTGSGKSNIMQVCIVCLSRCEDTLIWVIDLNGGGLALPHILPWWESRATSQPLAAPAVDWMAADGDEALLLANTALAISRDRKTTYQKLMREANDDKIPVSPKVPAIIVVVDEIANIMGERTEHPEVRDALAAIQNEGRASGVRVIFGALRATAEMIGGVNVKAQAQLRIGMRVTDPSELVYLFGHSRGISPADIPYEGCGFLALRQDDPRPYKAFRLKPRQIEENAREVADIRPPLDAPGVAVGARAYTERWDRAARRLDAASGGTPLGPGSPPGAAPNPGGVGFLDRVRDALKNPSRRPGGGSGDSAPAVPLGGEADGSDAPWVGDIRSRFDELIPDLSDDSPESSGGDSGNGMADARVRMLELLRDAGPEGMRRVDLFAALTSEGFSMTPQAVSDWLRAAVARGDVVQPVKRGPYVHRDCAEGDLE